MKLSNVLCFALLAVTLSSCMSHKKLQYIRDDGKTAEYRTERKSKTIKPFDELYIKVLSTDEKTAAIFSIESRSINSDLHLVSYTVNEKGEIYFPFVGRIPVKDLTLEEASEKVQSALSQYLLNTAVRVRFINNSITVLGQVEKGGDFTFSTDKLSIFQAIGLAGGISNYGDREKVTVIRMIDNKTTFNEVNLAAKNIVESKFYYIEPNDVVIVKPLKAVTRTFQNHTYATILASVSSLMAVLLFIKTY